MGGREPPRGPSSSMMSRPPSYMAGPPGASPTEVENLAAWIKSCMERTKVVQLQLKQRSQSEMAAANIQEWWAEDLDNKTPEDIAEMVMADAYKDAESQRSATRYVVLAYKEGDSISFARTSFRLQGMMEMSNDDFPDEGPNEKGLISQMMRHTEASFRMALNGMSEIVRGLSTQLQQSNNQVNKLVQQQHQVLEMGQTMLDRQNERDLQIRQMDAEDKRKGELFEGLKVLWPVLLKKVLGEGKSVEALLGEEQITTVLGSLQPSQITDIISTLNDAQKASFMTLYTMYRDRQTKKPAGDGKDGDKGGGTPTK